MGKALVLHEANISLIPDTPDNVSIPAKRDIQVEIQEKALSTVSCGLKSKLKKSAWENKDLLRPVISACHI